jgi:hypothetical protein
MAVVGFYAIHNSEIRFGNDGHWYADGDRIENRRIADLFSRSVERGPGGGYILRVGDETASIAVDDTPYVVTAVAVGDHVRATLNDGTEERIAPESIELSRDNVFYCRVKNGSEPARLLRPAHYQLAAHVGEHRDGEFVLRLGTRELPIRQR